MDPICVYRLYSEKCQSFLCKRAVKHVKHHFPLAFTLRQTIVAKAVNLVVSMTQDPLFG